MLQARRLTPAEDCALRAGRLEAVWLGADLGFALRQDRELKVTGGIGCSSHATLFRLGSSPFVRNVVVVMTGSATAQAVGFVLAPVISRLFTPADFGVYGSFGAVTSAIVAIATLDYSQAVMLPRLREDAGQVLLLSCLATLAASLLCAAVCVLWPDWLSGLLNTRNGWLLALLVVAVLVGGFRASFQAWCVRVKAFKPTSAAQVVRGLSANGLQVGFGTAQGGAAGLLLGSVLGELLASLSLLRVIRTDLRAFLAVARWSRLRQLAVEYQDFPLYSATPNLLNALSNGLPVLLLAHFFGLPVAGAYAFGIRLLNGPMSLISGAFRPVFFQKAAEMQHEGRRLFPLFAKSTAALFGIGLLPAIVLGVWSPPVFAWAFGGEWQVAGEFARYLIPWLFIAFCNVPAVLLARIIRIQLGLFCYDGVLLVGRTITLIAGGLWLTALQTIALVSLVGAAMNLVLILFVGRAVLNREGRFTLAQLDDHPVGSTID